jgi:hypothetical protein
MAHWKISRAHRAIRALAELTLETALAKRGNQTREVPVNHSTRGDVITVRPYERLAANGIVIADKAASTKDPLPVNAFLSANAPLAIQTKTLIALNIFARNTGCLLAPTMAQVF